MTPTSTILDGRRAAGIDPSCTSGAPPPELLWSSDDFPPFGGRWRARLALRGVPRYLIRWIAAERWGGPYSDVVRYPPGGPEEVATFGYCAGFAERPAIPADFAPRAR